MISLDVIGFMQYYRGIIMSFGSQPGRKYDKLSRGKAACDVKVYVQRGTRRMIRSPQMI